MSDRALVTVRAVSEIRPIPDADKIELAIVDGWQCVVKKGEFCSGDKGLYFEIDSFLPAADPRFGFLAKDFRKWNGLEGAKLKTVKLRGQLSQGLLLPVKDFPEVEFAQIFGGGDIAEKLNIVKWEAPIPACLGGVMKGNFPSFIPKTDQERIQNIPWVLDKHAEDEFEVTVKLDGSSMTVYCKLNEDGTVESGVCSRNMDLVETDANTFWRVAKKNTLPYALTEYCKAHGRSLAIQGELIGEGIQGNNEKLTGQGFYVFDIFDIAAQAHLAPMERRSVIAAMRTEQGCELNHVPILSAFKKLSDFGVNSLRNVLDFAEGPSMNPLRDREGIVFKGNTIPVRFKAISNKYLLRDKS